MEPAGNKPAPPLPRQQARRLNVGRLAYDRSVKTILIVPQRSHEVLSAIFRGWACGTFGSTIRSDPVGQRRLDLLGIDLLRKT